MSDGTGFHLEKLGAGDLLEVEDRRRFKRIADDAFPPEERLTVREFSRYGVDERCVMYLHRDEGDVIDGFALTVTLADSSVFLWLFATDAEKRGQGLGGYILDAVIADAGDRLLVAEIEPPGSTPMAERRAGFYRRHGMTVNTGEYIMPSSTSDDDMRMLLISHPGALEGEAFERVKALIYENVYEGYVPEGVKLSTATGKGRHS